MRYNKIAISGLICTGKSTLLKNLSSQLEWKTFSTGEYFRSFAKKHNLSLEEAEEQSEKITKKVDLKVKNLLEKSQNIIVDGWMSGIMSTKQPDVLRVLLYAKDDIRIGRFAKRERIAFDKAKKKLFTREKNYLAKMQVIYKRNDFFAPVHFNLIIDTTSLTPAEVLKKVCDTIM